MTPERLSEIKAHLLAGGELRSTVALEVVEELEKAQADNKMLRQGLLMGEQPDPWSALNQMLHILRLNKE